jgi:hypothetical protein
MTPPLPRDSNVGVAPEVAMHILDSDVHHLREQTDADRRSFARRLTEDRARMERIETAQAAAAVQVARAADSVSLLAHGATAMQATQTLILREMHRAQGAVRFLRWILGAGLLIEIGRLWLEHAK